MTTYRYKIRSPFSRLGNNVFTGIATTKEPVPEEEVKELIQRMSNGIHRGCTFEYINISLKQSFSILLSFVSDCT